LLFSLGVILVFTGFALTFVAVILLLFTTMKGKGKVRGGGAVIIGPVPIVFGTDKESVRILFLLSAAIIVLLLIVTVIYYCALK